MRKDGSPKRQAQTSKSIAYLGLGANLGDPATNLDRAIAAVARLPQTEVRRQSARYWTAPVGVTDQPPFLNQVIEIATGLDASALLASVLAIEAELGRVRTLRWGPRTIDIDILTFGDEQHETPDLIVPHPRICERAFVLVPFAELAPDLVIEGAPLRVHLANLPESDLASVQAAT